MPSTQFYIPFAKSGKLYWASGTIVQASHSSRIQYYLTFLSQQRERSVSGNSSMWRRRFCLLAVCALILSIPESPLCGQDTSPARLDADGEPLPEGALARLGTLRWRNGHNLSFIAFAESGQQLLTSCGDGIIHVCDVSSGKELRQFGEPMKPPPPEKLNLGAQYFLDSVKACLVAASADAGTVAVAAPERVTLWEVSTGKKLDSFAHNYEPLATGLAITGLVVTNDAKLVLTRAADEKIKVWDAARGKVLRELGEQNAVKRQTLWPPYCPLVLSPDGKLVADLYIGPPDQQQRQQTNELRVWDVNNGNLSWKYDEVVGANEGANSPPPAFSADSKRLASMHFNGSIHLCHMPSGIEYQVIETPKRKGEQTNAISLQFSPDGKTLGFLTHSGDNRRLNFEKSIQLFDLASGRYLRQIGSAAPRLRTNDDVGVMPRDDWILRGKSLAWSADGKTLADWDHGLVRLWNVDTGEGNDLSGGHFAEITQLCLSKDGKSLVSSSTDRTVRTWDIGAAKLKEKFEWPTDAITAHLITGDCGLYVSMRTTNRPNTETTLHFLDLPQARERFKIVEAEQARYYYPLMCSSASGNLLAIPAQNRQYDMYHLADSKADLSNTYLDLRGLDYFQTQSAACSSDGKLIAIGLDEGDRRLPNPSEHIESHVRLLDEASGSMLWQADVPAAGCRAVHFSPNGRTIAASSGTGEAVVLLETASGKQRGTFKLTASALAFSPDSLFLATGMLNGDVKLFYNGKEIASFHGHSGKVHSLLFSRDGETLFSGGAEGTILVWDIHEQVRKARPQKEISTEGLKALWADLADADASKAYQAIAHFSNSPGQAAALFKEHLKPAQDPEPAEVDKLVAALDSDDFEARQKAVDALAELGTGAREVLLKSLEAKPSLETRKRVEELIDKLKTGTPSLPRGILREIRAVEVLEGIDNKEARSLLESLAKGVNGARLTSEAAAALKRGAK